MIKATLILLAFLVFFIAPLSAQDLSTTELQRQYDIVEKQIGHTTNLVQLDKLIERADVLSAELTKRNQAALEANTVKINAVTDLFLLEDRELQKLNTKKWCHSNPWRWIRHYRKPSWCEQ